MMTVNDLSHNALPYSRRIDLSAAGCGANFYSINQAIKFWAGVLEGG